MSEISMEDYLMKDYLVKISGTFEMAMVVKAANENIAESMAFHNIHCHTNEYIENISFEDEKYEVISTMGEINVSN